MPKIFNYIRSIFFAALFVLALTVCTFGQNGKLQNDLNDSFRKFSLVKLNKQKTRGQVAARQTISIPTDAGELEVKLTPNDLRTAGYRAEDTGRDGIQPLEKGEVTTFKGTVAGKSDSEVRMTISGAVIEGYVAVGGEKFFVEPARNFSGFAGSEDVVVYREKDLLKNEGFACDTELTERIKRGAEMVAADAVESAQELRVVELATEADFQYVTLLGGAAQANSDILSVLNMVQGMYERELNLSISVTYQHTWSTPDSFDATNANTLLVSFKDYWNANYPQSQRPRDTTHLFSGKPNISGVGLAYIGVVGLNPNFAYGLSGRTLSAPVNALVASHEIGHNLGARHVDATQSCANTTMNPVLSDETPPIFCGYSRNEVASYVAANGAALKIKPVISPAARTKFDFDGDGRADVAVWRVSNGNWYINKSSNSSFNSVQFGTAGDRVVAADYDGDGKADIAVYRAGMWYQLKSATNTFESASFGNSTDIPIAVDFDGDGKADPTVFRPREGVWYRLLSGSGYAYSALQFGADGDVPLPADYDGDGKADINVWRPSSGVWYRIKSRDNSFFSAQFGTFGDKPIMGDFDGDGKADLVVWRPSNGVWYQTNSGSGAFSATNFGTSGDVPVAADYDGDGRADLSVFRPSNGYWYRLNSSTGAFAFAQFGAAGDVPIPIY